MKVDYEKKDISKSPEVKKVEKGLRRRTILQKRRMVRHLKRIKS